MKHEHIIRNRIDRLISISEVLSKKIDQSTILFIERVSARGRGDLVEAEMIERMSLEPLDLQIKYLAEMLRESAEMDD